MFPQKTPPGFFPSSMTGFFAAPFGTTLNFSLKSQLGNLAFVGRNGAAKSVSNAPLKLSGISCSGVTRCQSVSI